MFTSSPKDGVSHATRSSTRAASVGHFGSAVTILDKGMMLWSQNGGGRSARLLPQAADGVVYTMSRLVGGEGRSQHV